MYTNICKLQQKKEKNIRTSEASTYLVIYHALRHSPRRRCSSAMQHCPRRRCLAVTELTNYTKLSKKIIHRSRRFNKLKPV
jgi:hypothetical protein